MKKRGKWLRGSENYFKKVLPMNIYQFKRREIAC